MKARFTWLGIVAACILGISTAFVSCENEVNAVVKYVGKVVHAGSTKPFANLEVKVTNGEKIHDLSHTDDYGAFTLTVKVGDIDGSYYVLIGDTSCATKKIELSSFGQAQVDLGTIEIEGPGLPTVTTKPITDISDNKATSGGNVTADGRASVIARGVCWSKSEYPTIDDEHTQNGSGLGEYKSQLTNLEAGATYYVRAYATNRIGTAYGEQLTLLSKTGLPQVTTDEVSNISATTAMCGGNIAANSGYAITARGICWSDKTATPTINNNHTEEVATTGHFTSMMIGLERNTTYYVRAYAVNEKGTNYGETKTFTTGDGKPILSTISPTINDAMAVSGGNIISDEGSPITARGICYGTLPNPDLSGTYEHTSNGTGIGYFTSSFNLPIGSGRYYIRAYATNANGTTYGEQVEVIQPYDELPTFNYGGHTYKVAPVANSTFSWTDAINYCDNLTFCGYTDWQLPTKDELLQMYNDRTTIGYYVSGAYWSSSADYGNPTYYYYVDFASGKVAGISAGGTRLHVRPIRIDK